MADYNLSEAFAVIEDYLIDSMRRNMLRHIAQEQREYFSWSQWQADMLSGLREYKRENADKFKGIYPAIEQKIEDAMREAYDTGEAVQEQVILSAIRKGYTAYRPKNTQNGEFFRMNKRKMNALVTETQKSMTKATAAALRMANDQYRSIIFGAQVFYNSGAGTLWQAVDMASKKFLQAGLNCIEYRNGNRVNIASYAEMALRTANTRAYLHGEAAMRERYGIHTVIVNRHNAACPLCVPFQGRVFIDDVWGGGTAAEAQVKGYPLLSEAMAAGLYHPNCKDGHTTFFVGINEFHPPTTRMKEEQVRRYELQQQQRYHERQIRKYKRLCQGTVDEETRIGYTKKLHEWQQRTQALIDGNEKILRRTPPREQLRNIPEELGITPPRNPPGVEIFASVKPPSEPPKKDKIRSVIDVKAYSTSKKPPPSIGPSEAERKRDIERIKAKVQLVRKKAREMESEAQTARERALFATENAKAADYNAKRTRQQSAEEIQSIKAKAKIRDKQVTRQMWDAKLSAAEARRLRSAAEIAKTEARAAQRRYATLMKLDNDGKLKVSVETRTAHPTAVKVKPTPKSKPVATVSVKAKPPVTVSIADEQRRKDIETIRAKVRLVKQKAAEMEKEAQAAKQAAQALDAKAQKATQKAERAQQTVEAIRAKTRLREQQVSKQVRDAKLSAAEARRLRRIAEIDKTEARAAQRRYVTLMKLDNGGRLKVSVETKTSRPGQVKVKKALHNGDESGIIKTNKSDNISRIFSPTSSYKDDKGNFDIEKAKADLEEKIETVVSAKCAPFLRTVLQSVEFVETGREDIVFGYDSRDDTVKYNKNHPAFGEIDFITATIHELSHRIDFLSVQSWKQNEFSTAISGMQAAMDNSPATFTEYCFQHDKDGYLSDVLDAGCLGKHDFPFFHPSDYWKDSGNQCREIFANIFSLEAIGDTEKLSSLEEWFPELMKAYHSLDFSI